MFYQCFMGYLNMSQSVAGYLNTQCTDHSWPSLTSFIEHELAIPSDLTGSL